MEIVKEIEAMARKAAIYHYTDGSTRRPKIYIDQLNRLEEYAKAHNLTVMEIFCDKSIKRSERFEFDRFLSCASQFDVLIVKDFFHISKKYHEMHGDYDKTKKQRRTNLYTGKRQI